MKNFSEKFWDGPIYSPISLPYNGGKNGKGGGGMAGTVWAVRWEGALTEELRAALWGKLSPADRARCGTFPAGGRAGERGRQFLLSRTLLAFALEETEGTVPVLAKTAAGQPYFPERPGLFLSLGHTEGAALLALADAPVGVDIERVRSVPPRLGRDFSGTAEGFWRRWTAAEAAAKREGRGAGALLPLGRGGLPEVPGARPLSLWPDCAAALAGEGAFPIRTLTAEELAK